TPPTKIYTLSLHDALPIYEIDSGASDVKSTAADLAAFYQMLLNHGSRGARQILSRASVAAMSRPQIENSIPLIMPVFRDGKRARSEEHTSELQSPCNLVCR